MSNLEHVVQRLEAVANKLESVSGKGGSGSGGSGGDTSEMVEEFEAVMKHVSKLQELTNIIGSPELKEQLQMVNTALNAQKNFLVVASKCKPPTAGELQKLIKPTADAIDAVQAVKEKHRSSKQFNHLSCISDWIQVLGWVTVPGKTAKFVHETAAGAHFYGNRILKDFKGKDENHIHWVRAVQPISDALENYVKEHHAGGVAWKVGGVAASSVPAPAAGAGAPPPPPPSGAPPPPPAGGAGKSKVADAGALFSELNKGSNVTSGLKKVDPSMQTHKNPSLRAGAVVPAKAPSAAAKPAAPAKSGAAPAKKAPVFEKVGKKWMVEHQVGNRDLVINECTIKESLYIYKCVDTVVQVKSKMNSIVLDGCKKTSVVFGDLLSTCEFVNCQSVQAQANGFVPTISIDKTDGCQLYLNDQSIKADIVTAKSSEMNVLIVKKDGDLTEFPIPEQFKTKYDGKKLTTEPLDIVA